MYYYLVHIATAFQSFKTQPREIQEIIWARTQKHHSKKDPNHPILSAALEQYLSKQTPDLNTISSALKSQMALTPEFGRIIALAKALVDSRPTPRMRVEVTPNSNHERELLQSFWKNLGIVIQRRGMPIFVTWNGLDFTFPFLTERSISLGVEPSCVLPRARYQPWKHIDLLAELGNYDHQRYLNLESRATLWGLNGTSGERHPSDHETITEQWQKGNIQPLQEHLNRTLETLQKILRLFSPYVQDTKNNH